MILRSTARFLPLLALVAIAIAPAPLLAEETRSPANGSEQPTTRKSADEAPAAIKKIKLPELEALKARKDAVVLDVRTPKEFAAGHIPGAVNIDWHSRDFNKKVEQLDKSKTYLVHCLSGVRSAAATRRMSRLHFQHLYDYSGGWMDYRKSGKPIEQ